MHLRKDKIPYPFYIAGLLILIFIMLIISVNAGYIQIPAADIWATITGQGTPSNELTIFQFRLPRMFIALLVGAGIAVSGAILQAISKNELADPGILGINAGAGFMIVLYIFFIQGNAFYQSHIAVFIMPLVALFGAFLAAGIIFLLAWKKGSVKPTRMILVGIGVNAGFTAGLTIFQMKMNPIDFTQALVWISGSIWSATWTYVLAALPWLIILIPLALYKARTLDVLNLGEQSAIGVGVNVNKERGLLLLIAVGLAGSCVAIGGGITFVGLIAPHIARTLVGTRHQRMLPVCLLFGGLLVLTADTIARVILAPLELPVGIVLSIIGAPYFIYLLLFKK